MSKWSAWPAEPIKDLSEIRRRHARDESRSSLWDNNPYVMHRDREWLLAEIKRLRAEVERLRGEMPVADSLRIAAECAQIERDEARAVVLEQAKENADLRAEVERLHGLLKGFSRDMVEEIESLTRERDEARAYIEARRREAKS